MSGSGKLRAPSGSSRASNFGLRRGRSSGWHAVADHPPTPHRRLPRLEIIMSSDHIVFRS
eukprot:3270836-Rhodomonas_salina.3